jgi:hypothetical protein
MAYSPLKNGFKYDMVTFIKNFLLLLLVSVNLLNISFAQQLQKEVSQKSTSNEEFISHHQCEKKFEYAVFLAGANVGNYHRVIKWNDIDSKISAEVSSAGRISILWLNSTYAQTSSMLWLPQHNYFITPNFTQRITGIRAREMNAVTSNEGTLSTVNLDGEINIYQNNNNPLYDIDTLGAQIRINLLQNKQNFILYRQATDQIKKYHFIVADKEVINHKKWGELNVIKIKEVGKYNKMVLWFSPKLDYQLVKAQLDAFISPMIYLTNFIEKCDVKKIIYSE